jgi:hypothetical protein
MEAVDGKHECAWRYAAAENSFFIQLNGAQNYSTFFSD